MEIRKGAVVRVTAGKEKDKIFVVIQDFESDRVLIANGRHRKLANPKRKSVKHLEVIGSLAAVPERDRLIWKSLSPFRGE
ncbi:MAG: KOW domain-containing RNA-binding protein [Clostridia bacterium]|nr:KOW domain-containing RNA-binding protein [Clostridia bacterium]